MIRLQSLLLAAVLCFAPNLYAATFGTISADGNTSAVWSAGPVVFRASGTWGSGTFKVYILSADGTNYRELVSSTAMTSDATGQLYFDIPGGHYFRATLSGSSSPSLVWEFFGTNAQ